MPRGDGLSPRGPYARYSEIPHPMTMMARPGMKPSGFHSPPMPTMISRLATEIAGQISGGQRTQ